MKNKLLAMFAVAAIGFSFSSMSMATLIDGDVIKGNDGGDCPILGEDVRLNLSKGVKGAYECSEVSNSIDVGACHESGSRGTALTCAQIGFEADGTTPKYNNAGCTAANVGDTITITTASYKGFRASTTGGSVGAQSLSAKCTDSTVEELLK